jgi:hypothetical protein
MIHTHSLCTVCAERSAGRRRVLLARGATTRPSTDFTNGTHDCSHHDSHSLCTVCAEQSRECRTPTLFVSTRRNDAAVKMPLASLLSASAMLAMRAWKRHEPSRGCAMRLPCNRTGASITPGSGRSASGSGGASACAPEVPEVRVHRGRGEIDASVQAGRERRAQVMHVLSGKRQACIVLCGQVKCSQMN